MDRYIARLYLINVLTLLVLLGGFVVTVDVFVNLTRFSKAAIENTALVETGAEEPEGLALAVRTTAVIAGFWGPKLLQLYNYLIGIVLVAAMGFTCAQLVRQREFVALLASGVPLHRMSLPFAAVALLLTGLQAVNQEVFVPKVAPLLARDVGDAGASSIEAFTVRLVPDDEGRVFQATRFDPDAGTLEGLTVFERDGAGVVVRVVRADGASWDGAGWVLENGIARGNDGASRADAPTPVDRLDSSLDPTRLKIRHLRGFGESLAWGQITQIIEAGGMDGQSIDRLDRVRWGRLASMASNLVVLFAALPFFLRKLPGPMILAGLKAAPVGLLGLVAAGAAPSMPVGGLPVWIGVFIPTLVLMPLAVALFAGVKS
ncbi:MAG: LptF/LptG family permease [Planctomycetota bacterium]